VSKQASLLQFLSGMDAWLGHVGNLFSQRLPGGFAVDFSIPNSVRGQIVRWQEIEEKEQQGLEMQVLALCPPSSKTTSRASLVVPGTAETMAASLRN